MNCQHQRMIHWTFTLVATLALATGFSLLQPPLAEKAQVHSRAYVLRQHALLASTDEARRALAGQASPAVDVLGGAVEFEHVNMVAIGNKAADGPSVNGKGKRAPASQTRPSFTAMALNDENTLQAVELVLTCRGEQKFAFKKSVTQVRISGEACAPSQQIVTSEIRNVSNGSEATVFLPSGHHFTTDYVALAPARNTFHVTNTLKNGEREEREFIVERASPDEHAADAKLSQ